MSTGLLLFLVCNWMLDHLISLDVLERVTLHSFSTRQFTNVSWNNRQDGVVDKGELVSCWISLFDRFFPKRCYLSI